MSKHVLPTNSPFCAVIVYRLNSETFLCAEIRKFAHLRDRAQFI